MKALFKNMTLALTTMLILVACTKTSLPDSISGPQSSPTEVSKIFVKGDAVDLSLNVYSSSDPSTSFNLSVDGRLIERFRLPQNDDLKWHFDYLSAGTHRINIFVEYSTNTNPTFSFFQFNISDGNHSQTVTSTKIDQRNYGFDLIVEK